MRIENIEITNFRQLKNLQFKFGCKPEQNDLHIILANNGVGKTNLLNAITWCLYDNEMHLGDKYTACEKLNTDYVQDLRERLNENGNTIGELSVQIYFSSDDSKEKVIFKRIGKFNITKDAVVLIETTFSIMHFIDGEWNSIENEEETLAYVKKYVPEEIHDYIFFDGEHLEDYFKAGQSETIKNGIEELTQVKIVEKAAKAFNNYLTDVLNPQISSSTNKDISDAQKNLDKIQEAIDSSSKTISEYNTQIHRCDDKIADLDKTISGHINVSDKTSRLKEVENLLDVYEQKIAKQRYDLMKFTREYTVYFALYPAIKDFYKYIREQGKNGKLPPRIDKFLLDSIEKHKHCLICDQDIDEHSMTFIENLKKELEVSSATSALLNQSISILRSYLNKISKYKELRETYFNNLKELTEKQKSLLEEQKQLTTYLINIPNNEKIALAIQQKKEFIIARDGIIGKRGVESSHKKDLENDFIIQDKNLKNLVDKNKQLEKVRELSEYCKKCRNILNETRVELLAECRCEMEEETFNTFNDLIWKKDAFTKIEILEDYTFKLLDIYGSQTLGSCSAAERALLALSFTLALQKVSMHDSLIFIDTPIGRVDPDNRQNFIETLCNISKTKQVILTFTPAEYDNNVKAQLLNKYASFTTLIIENGITKIK